MPEGEIFVERRKFKRIERKIKVFYKIISSPTEIEEIKKKAQKKATESINISMGGIQLLIEGEELKPEQLLRIEFNVEKKPEPIITFAEVRWISQDKKTGTYKTGIEFLVLKEEDKKIINELINNQ